MSILPASYLSSADLARLGNNVRRDAGGVCGRRPVGPGRRKRRRLVAAVNRSLAGLGERVASLHRRPVTVA